MIAASIAENTSVNLRPFPSEFVKDQQARNIESAGLRWLPYPFWSVITVTNDADASTWEHNHQYAGMLAGHHGLDFGDSAFLSSRLPEAIAFLDPSLCERKEVMAEGQRVFTTHELAAEAHLGNIDHWHSILNKGPRVLILDQVSELHGDRRQRHMVQIPRALEPSSLSGYDYHAAVNELMLAVTLVVEPGVADAIVKVEAVPRGEDVVSFKRATDRHAYRFLNRDCSEGRYLFFTLDYPAGAARGAPSMEQVERLEIVFSRPIQCHGVHRVYVHNAHSGMLLDRLAWLQREFGFCTNLVTKHSRYHFYTTVALKRENERNRAQLNGDWDRGKTYYGSFDQPGLRFSTVADEAASFARVFPEVSRDFGIRFFRMVQGKSYPIHALNKSPTTRYHCDLRDVVYPIMSRLGTPFYNLCSAFPPLPERCAEDPAMVPERSIAGNFMPRLETILANLREAPGEIAVFYTHLGNWEGWSGQREIDFNCDAMAELKERVFGFGCRGVTNERIWFARPSVVADYALMMQALPEHVVRAKSRQGEQIRIQSWHDPVLDARLPTAARQLYGLTFYVNDLTRARVFLDGKEIDEIVRNPVDETGRSSVTVAHCGIRHVLMDDVDPQLARNRGQFGGQWNTDGRWRWHTDVKRAYRGQAYGSIAAPSFVFLRPRIYRVVFSCQGLRPVGTQHFFYSVRRSHRGVAFGIILETETGGRFYFGDEALEGAAGALTARYCVAPESGLTRQWQRVVVPFCDLSWGSVTPLSAPLPSHPPGRIMLLASLRSFESVAVDAIEYGRPKSCVRMDAKGTIVVGGHLQGAKGSESIALRPVYDLGAASVRRARVDAAGAFRFKDLEPGAYEFAVHESNAMPNWNTAALFDLQCDCLHLILKKDAAVGRTVVD